MALPARRAIGTHRGDSAPYSTHNDEAESSPRRRRAKPRAEEEEEEEEEEEAKGEDEMM